MTRKRALRKIKHREKMAHIKAKLDEKKECELKIAKLKYHNRYISNYFLFLALFTLVSVLCYLSHKKQDSFVSIVVCVISFIFFAVLLKAHSKECIAGHHQPGISNYETASLAMTFFSYFGVGYTALATVFLVLLT